MNSNISLCIISYDKDYTLIFNLLEEFQKQTLAPKEIIFYCSGVDCVSTMPEFITINHIDVPIYTIFNKQRTNQAKARNIVSSMTNGEYVMFFDVDDLPNPSKIEITQKILSDHPDTDFVLHNYHQIIVSLGQKSNISEPIKFEKLDLFPIDQIDPLSTNVVCKNYHIHHAHVTVRKSILDKIKFNDNIEYYRKEDGKFCQDLVKNNYKGLYCPLELVDYIV